MKIEIKDMSQDFMEFYKRSKGLCLDNQKKLWNELYYNPNKEIFDHLKCIFGIGKESYNFEKDLERCLPLYDNHYDKIEELSDLSKNIKGICELCKETYEIDDIELKFIILVGIFSANAFVTGFRGGSAFYFLEKMPEKREVNILLVHEITHLFQFSRIEDKGYEATLGELIFSEGVATYASEVINPGFELSQYLYIYKNFEEWINAAKVINDDIKSDILQNINSTDYKYRKKYLQGDNSIIDGVPSRIGYLIGYKAIKYLNSLYNINEIICWSREQIQKNIREAIMEVM